MTGFNVSEAAFSVMGLGAGHTGGAGDVHRWLEGAQQPAPADAGDGLLLAFEAST
jgi:hypothetical protein